MLKRSLVTKTGSLLLGFVFLFFTTQSFANITVDATVDRNKLYPGDTFIYTVAVSIASDNSVGMENPDLPEILGKFDILKTWASTESRTSFVNGDYQIKNTKKFNYMFTPKKTGKLVLGVTKVNVDGKIYKTKAIVIDVARDGVKPDDSNAGRNQARGRGQRQRNRFGGRPDPFDDLFSQLLNRHGNPGNIGDGEPIDPKDAFFIKVVVDKAKVYVGEQVTATWYLYTRGDVRDIDTLKYPSLNGFWKEDIEVATRLTFNREIVNGVAYKRALLASYALFPIKSGPNIIDAYEARCGILLPGFGFGKTVKSVKKSQELTIQVMDLPVETKPDTFNGGVGKFKLSSKIDTQTIEANQPLTMTLRFEGMGNAKLINLPTLNIPENVELYDKKSDAKFYKNGKSYKDFKVLLVPREEGGLNIPPMKFSAFDPATAEYYDMESKSFNVRVLKAKPGSKITSIPLAETKSTTKKEEYVPQLQTDWEHMKVSKLFRIKTSTWFAIYLLIFAIMIYLYLREMGLTQRKKTIQKLIQSKFKSIDSLSNKDENWRDVGSELTNMIYMCLGAVSDSGGSGYEFDKLLEMAPPSVKRDMSELITKKMKLCETISFAPDSVVGDLKNKKNIKKQVKEINKLVVELIDLGMGDTNIENS